MKARWVFVLALRRRWLAGSFWFCCGDEDRYGWEAPNQSSWDCVYGILLVWGFGGGGGLALTSRGVMNGRESICAMMMDYPV